MANLKSSIKDIRRTRRRTARNQASLSRIGTAVKAVRSAKSKEAANAALLRAGSLLDRAAHSGLMHWRKVARQKSNLSRMINRKF
jgi:small subunit ribosomal protein S20